MTYHDRRRRRRRLARRRPGQHRPERRRQPVPRHRSSAAGATDRGSRTTWTPTLQRPVCATWTRSARSTTSTSASAGRSSATSCGSSARPAIGGVHDAPVADTFDVPSGGPTSSTAQTGARRLRAGHRRPAHQERDAAPHLAGRARATSSALYYDEIDKFRGHGINAGRRHRHADGVADLDLAALQRRRAQVDQPAQQPAPPRGRVTRSTTRST